VTSSEGRKATVTTPTTLQITDVIPETDDAVSLVFAVPTDDAERWAYRPGQFLTLRIPGDRTGSVARCYSLASAPGVDRGLRVTVKRTAGGYGSNWLCDNAKPGTQMDALPPAGNFTPRTTDGDFLLFAGGSGITPVFSILRTVLANGTGRITLFYANRDERSVIFRDDLKQLAEAHPDRLEIVHWLESVQGLPSAEILAEIARARPGRQSFTCGPAPFMKAVVSALTAAGVPREAVHTEVFTSLSGDPFSEVAPSAIESTAATTPVLVEINGDTHDLDWPADVTMVDLLLSKGVEVPYMCRDGECGTCQAVVESGEVRMEGNNVLDEEDLADGYVLTCQAHPCGKEKIRIVF